MREIVTWPARAALGTANYLSKTAVSTAGGFYLAGISKLIEFAGLTPDGNEKKRKTAAQLVGKVALVGDSCTSDFMAQQTVEALSNAQIVNEGDEVVVTPILTEQSLETYRAPSAAADNIRGMLEDSFESVQVEVKDVMTISPGVHKYYDINELVDNSADRKQLLVMQPFLAQRIFADDISSFLALPRGGISVLQEDSQCGIGWVAYPSQPISRN